MMGPKADSSNMEDVVLGEDREPSQSVSFVSSLKNATSITNQVPVAEEGIHCPRNISNDICRREVFPNNEDQSSFPSQEKVEIPCSMNTGVLAGCIPGYYAYESGQVMPLASQCLDQQPLPSSHTVSSGPEIMPVCTWDSQPAIIDSLSKARSPGTRTNAHTAGFRVDLRDTAKTLNLKSNPATSSGFPGKDTTPLNKAPNLTSGFQAVKATQGYNHSQTITSLSRRGQVGFFHRDNHTKPRVTGQAVHGYDRFGMIKNYSTRKNFQVSSELVCGPRVNGTNSSSSLTGKANLNRFVHRDKYNKSDFQIEYKEAKFFMIKSNSEDDIHKCIKYNVWASTPNGNKKLDAAFWDAESVMKKGSKCPIFLFFSVNASGQFVGLAEMIGPVDFNKNMDFWQQEIWNGFFPVKWHIIKDIPNRKFQNIRHENNDNKAVTFSKDTQEIGLPQGLQMLHIFKSYLLVTSLLDDFEFYEQREKSLRAMRKSRRAMMDSDMEFYDDISSMKHMEAAVGKMNVTGKSRKPSDIMPSPANTRRLSVNNHSQARS